ncbi:MAG: hypothetical protein KI785_11525 [Devosiaceae bacterium]|nr:hypothetical protein [Devosiaceae bacterium MH13]
MITSILFVDVQAMQARVGGAPAPQTLVGELRQTMHGLDRHFPIMHAYCAPSVDLTTRSAYRDVGFAIHDSSGTDETLIQMTLDLTRTIETQSGLEEVILLGRSNYTPLARLTQAAGVMVSVADRPDMPPSLEALADGIVDIDEIVAARTQPGVRPARPANPAKPAQAKKPQKAETAPEEGDPWPDPAKGPILVAAAGTAASVGAMAVVEAETAEPSAEPPAPVTTAAEEAKVESEPQPSATIHALDVPATKPESVAEPAKQDTPQDADLTPELVAQAPSAEIVDLDAAIAAELSAEATDAAELVELKSDGTKPDAKTETDASQEDGGSVDQEVDELLSRLMSDGLTQPANDAQALDVVPER